MKLAALLAALAFLVLPLTAAAQVDSNFWNGGGVRVGTSTTTCDNTIRGSLRFNDTSKEIELCNGTEWTRIVGTVTSGPVAPAGSGYFVLTASSWDGNLGDLAGADAKCVTELTTNTDWKYYADANTDGLLDSTHIKAFLCDASSGCNNLMPLTTYYFARVGDSNAGGASFTTDASGLGPNDSASWAAANYFSGTFTYWVSRYPDTDTRWAPVYTTPYCVNYGTNSSGDTGAIGNSANTGGARWASGTSPCNLTQRLICFVNP